MDIRLAVKYSAQHVLTPFLRHGKRQRRVAIVHEVLPHERQVLGALLAAIDDTPGLDVTLTFDDGFVSSYEAIRSLEHRKAIFFVCPEYINRAECGNWEEFFHRNLWRTERLDDPALRDAVRPATWDQLRELVALGHTIGSHSMTHARLSSLRSRREREQEIRASADMIEDKLGTPVQDFAYPFGDIAGIDADAIDLVRQRYQRCFSGIRGNNHDTRDAFLQWRDTVHLYWTVSYSLFLLRGGFDGVYTRTRGRMARMVCTPRDL